MSDNSVINESAGAAEYCNVQDRLSSGSCFALMISRHYRLLAHDSGDAAKRESYLRKAGAWLSFYINHSSHSPKLRSRLSDYVLLHECK